MDRECAVSVAEAKEDQAQVERDEIWADFGSKALDIAVHESLIHPKAWDRIGDALGDMSHADMNLLGHYLHSGDFMEVGRRVDRAVRQFIRAQLDGSSRAYEIAKELSEGTQARVKQ